MGKWGSMGVFPQHFWNIGGNNEGYTSLTVVQPWYWFSVDKQTIYERNSSDEE